MPKDNAYAKNDMRLKNPNEPLIVSSAKHLRTEDDDTDSSIYDISATVGNFKFIVENPQDDLDVKISHALAPLNMLVPFIRIPQ